MSAAGKKKAQKLAHALGQMIASAGLSTVTVGRMGNEVVLTQRGTDGQGRKWRAIPAELEHVGDVQAQAYALLTSILAASVQIEGKALELGA